MTRPMVAISFAVLCAVGASQARADRRVTAFDFYGTSAERMRDAVVNLLERQSGVTIISRGQIESAADRLNVDPFSLEGRMVLSRELQLSAWITGVVQKRSGNLELTVVVFDGARHATIGRTRLTGSSAN